MSRLRPRGSDSREKQTENTRVAPVLWRRSAAAFFRSDTGRGGGCRSEKKSCGEKSSVDVEILQRHTHTEGNTSFLHLQINSWIYAELAFPHSSLHLSAADPHQAHICSHLTPCSLCLMRLSFFHGHFQAQSNCGHSYAPESYRIMIRLKVAR